MEDVRVPIAKSVVEIDTTTENIVRILRDRERRLNEAEPKTETWTKRFDEERKSILTFKSKLADLAKAESEHKEIVRKYAAETDRLVREAQPVIKQMAEEESPTTTLKTYLQKEFVDLVGDAYKRLAGANSKDVTDLMKPLLEKAEAIQQNTLRVLNTEAIKKEFAESSSTFKDEMKQLQTKLDNDITNVTSSMQEMKDKTVGMINELHLSDTVTAIQGVGDAYGKTVQQLQLAAQTIAGYKEPRLPEATVKAIDTLVSSAADQLTQFTEERTELRSQVQSIKGIVETGNQIGLRDIQQNLRNIAGSFETSLETLGTHISNIKDAVDAEDAGLVVTVRKLGGTASDLKQRIDTLSSQETEARAQRDEALRGLKTLNETYKSHNTTLGRLISSSQDGSLPKQMQGLASLLNSFDTKYGAQGTIATAEGERLRGFQDVKSSFDTILNQNLRGDAGLPKQVETMSKALDAFDTKYGSEGTVAQSEAQRLKDFNDLKDALRASADTLKQNLEGKQGLPERIRSLESVMSNLDATYGVEGTVSKAEAQRQKDFQGLKDSFDTCSTTLKDSIEGEDGLQKQTQALASSVQAIDTRHGENGTVNRAQDDFLRGARDVNTSISTATSTLQASLNDEGGLVKRVTQLGQEIEKLSVSRQNFESIRGDLHALIGQAPEDVAVVSLREMSASVQSAANDVANKVQEARNLLAQEQPYNSQSAQQLRRRVVELEVSQRVAIADKEKARASEAKFAYDVGGLAGEKKSLEENINALKERHEAELKTLQEAHAAELTRVAKAQEQSIFEATRSSQLEQEVLEKRLEGLQKLSTTYEHDSTGYASAMTKAQDTAARLEQENRYLIASVQPAVPELLKQYQDFIGNLFESVDQEDLQGIQDLRLQIPKLPSDYELFAGFPSQTSGSRQQPQGRQDLSGAMPGGRRYSAGGTNLPSAEMPGAAATSAAGQRDTARGVKRALGGAKDFTQRAADRANRLLGRTQQPSPSQQVPEDVSGAAPSRVRQRPASEEESRPGTAASDQAAVLRQEEQARRVRRRVEVTNPKESRPVNTNGLKLFVGPPSQNIAQSVPLTANLKDYITGMTVLRRGNARADNSESMTRCIAQLMTKKKTALGWSNPDGQCDWETAHQCVVMDAGEYVIHKNPTPEEKATYDSLFVEIEGRSSVEDSPRYSGQQTQGGAGASRSSEFERLTPRAESRGGGYYDGTRDVPMPHHGYAIRNDREYDVATEAHSSPPSDSSRPGTAGSGALGRRSPWPFDDYRPGTASTSGATAASKGIARTGSFEAFKRLEKQSPSKHVWDIKEMERAERRVSGSSRLSEGSKRGSMVERQTQNWELLLPSGSGMTPPGTPTGKLREKRGISMPIRSSIPSAEMMTKSTGKDLAEKAPGEDISATEVRGKNPTSPTKSGKTAADAKQEGLGIEKQKAADTEGEQEGEVTEKEKENKDEKKAAGAARAEPGEHGEGQDQVRCAPQ